MFLLGHKIDAPSSNSSKRHRHYSRCINMPYQITPTLFKTACTYLLGKQPITIPIITLLYKQWNYTEKQQRTKRRKAKARSHGGVLRASNGQETVYAVIFGRRANVWSLPKGRANFWETSIQTAYREIREETGIDLRHQEPTKEVLCGRNPMFVFDLPAPIEMHPEDTDEVVEARWMTLEELKQVKMNRGLKDFVERRHRGL